MMTPQRWAQIKEVFGAAFERTEAERAAYLDSACNGEPELRAEVDRLLAESNDDSLQSPVLNIARALAPGDTIAHYRIQSKLGEGGMGVVYKASDSRLGRSVALKFVKAQFDSRSQREARAVAALNHPNICTLFDVGPNYLVMELVEGPTLAERIAKGPISVAEALPIALQIAEALEAAHEKGIVHRDLKPANIKLTTDGNVKVLDFGLAKALSPIAEDSPTLTVSEVGLILGTPAYMSPEQASGKPIDERADIWSFGVVLWEMLTGHRLFVGDTVTQTLADVLRGPIDFDQLPVETPPAVRTLLRRCLERNLRNRLRDVADGRIELDEVLRGNADAVVVAAPRRRDHLPWVATAFLAVGLAIIATTGWWRATLPVDYSLVRLSVDLGPSSLRDANLTAVVSPDGRRLVFRAAGPDSRSQLATRLLDQSQTTLLPGTEGGRYPFFSPDSQWVGFFADRKLKKISVQGGATVTLCDAAYPWGGSWTESGTIIASLGLQSGLSEVLAVGGNPQSLTKPGKGEVTHRWPQVLPGGEAVLFTSSPTNIGMENARVAAMSLKNGATKTLVPKGYFGRYVPANRTRGYLLYFSQGVLLGVAFDLSRMEIQGMPTPLLDDVAVSMYLNGGGQFDFSSAPAGHGTLVYLAGKVAAQSWPVVWLDNSGKMQPLVSTPGYYSQPRFSPDGHRLAWTMRTSSGTDIYVHELERDTTTQLTFGGHAQQPVWTPDGRYIAFEWSGDSFGIGWVRSDGSGEPRLILERPGMTAPYSFSPDGRSLAYYFINPDATSDIWTVTLDTSEPEYPKLGKSESFLGSSWESVVPMFSPDGRWIAYRSNESGRTEIYVRPFPKGRAGKWQISTGGAAYTMWSDNGRELFFETTDHRIMVVNYSANGDSFRPGKPRLWSEREIFMPGNTNLALAPDGKRFAVFPMPAAAEPEKDSVHVTFLLNFLDELRRRLP